MKVGLLVASLVFERGECLVAEGAALRSYEVVGGRAWTRLLGGARLSLGDGKGVVGLGLKGEGFEDLGREVVDCCWLARAAR